jgi:hypothetical protein
MFREKNTRAMRKEARDIRTFIACEKELIASNVCEVFSCFQHFLALLVKKWVV